MPQIVAENDTTPSAPSIQPDEGREPVAARPDWDSLYAGIDGLENRVPEAVKAPLNRIAAASPNPKEVFADSVNQAYVASKMPDMPMDQIQKNWPSVSSAFAKQYGFNDGSPISPTELFNKISERRQADKQFETALEEGPAVYKPVWNMDTFWRDSGKPFAALPTATASPASGYQGQVAAGIYNSVFKPVMEGMESIQGVATLGIGSAASSGAKAGIPLAAKSLKAMGGLFTALFSYNMAKNAPATVKTLADPNATLQDKVEAAGGEVRDGALAVMGLLGMAYEAHEKPATLAKEVEGKSVGEAAKVLIRAANEHPDPVGAEVIQRAGEELAKISPEPVMAKEAEKPASISGAPKAPAVAAMDNLTGIKNEAVDQQLSEMGMEPATHGEKLSFKMAVDQAKEVLDKDPQAGPKLIDELSKTPRPVTGVENAILLHETTRLKLERDVAEKSLIDAQKAGDPDKVAEAQGRIAKARDDFAKAMEADTQVGTKNAQGLALRRMMLKEDYSLASMEQQFQAAGGGKELTPEEGAKVRKMKERVDKAKDDYDKYLQQAKDRMKRGTEKIRERLKAGDLEPKPRRQIVLDEEGLRLKAEYKRAQQDFQMEVFNRRMAARGPLERFSDTFVKWRRAFLLSNPAVLAKLTGAAFLRTVATPVEEAVGGALGKVPGISKVAEKAPREGGLSVAAEAKAFTDMFTKGMKDAADQIKKGSSDLDVLYEQARHAKMRLTELPTSAIDFSGHMHAALKSPVKRAEFARSFQKRVEFAIRQGQDVSDPLVQTRLAVDSYKDSQRAIFMQDNALSKAFTTAVAQLKQTGHPIWAGIAKTIFPIVKVPTNIVGETAQYAAGLPTGAVEFAHAAAKGFDKLKPEQADQIMRHLKKGLIGSAVMLLGYYGRKSIGGQYQPGEKRKAGDVPVESVRINGVDVPPTIMHHPVAETLQLGATIGRVADAKVKGHEQGVDDGIIAAGLGVAEQIPFARESVEMSHLFGNRAERTYAEGELLKSFLVAGLLQFIAEQSDRDDKGEKVKRKPGTVMEHVESGIPGLREDLPKRKPEKSRR